MKRQRRKLTLPAIRRFRESVDRNEFYGFLVDQCERYGAGNVKVKYRLKNKPYVITVEARKLRV